MRRVVPLIVAVVAALVAGVSWSISSPPGSTPDEDYHLASIWCPPPVARTGCTLTTDGAGKVSIVIPSRVADTSRCYAYNADASGECVLEIPAGSVSSRDRYDTGQYPGGYYYVMHLFVGKDVYSSVYLMRTVNLVLAILLGTGLVLASTRPVRRILAYAVATTFVPMGIFLVASVNPSGWALVGVTTAAFAMHSYWLSETRNRTLANGALAAIGLAMAMSSRADASLYSVIAIAALTVLNYRQVRRHLWRLVLPLVATVLCAVVYFRSTQAAGAASGSLFGSGGQEQDQVGLVTNNILGLPYLLFGNQGFGRLGNLGWLDTPVPLLAGLAMIMACTFMLMAGLSRMSPMKAVVTAGGMAVMIGLPLFMLQMSNQVVGDYVQARYLIPLFPIMSLVLLTGRRPDQSVRLGTLQAFVVWGLVSLAHAMALLVNIRRYVTGLDGATIPGAGVEWWMPGLPGPRITWIAGSLAFAVVAFLVVLVSRWPDEVPVVAATDSDTPEVAAGAVARTPVATTPAEVPLDGSPLT